MQDQPKSLNVRQGADSHHFGDYIGTDYCKSAPYAMLQRSARKSFYCSLAGLAVFLLSFILVPYVAAESAAHAETARAKTAWGTISLALDPDVDATEEYEATSGASGSQIGDAGHGNVEFGTLNPTARDTASGSYGTLRVLKKTIGVSTTGKYYTVYLSMSKKDINNTTNNNGLNLVTSTSAGSTVATDSSINLPAVAGTFDNPTTLSGPSWGFAVPNAKTTGNISSAGNFLTSYYTDSEINVSSTATGASDTYTNSLWAAVPTADSPVQIWKQETTNSTGFEDDTFDVYYAVVVDTNTLAGTYENNVVYTAVANAAAIDKASSNLQRDLAYGGAGDILTINFDLTNSTAYLEEDDITITLVPHDVMMANDYADENDINLTAIKANSTNLNCPVVTGSLDLLTGSASEVSAGKTTSIQCTVPEGSVEDGTGVGTYDILLTIAGYNYNYVSVYQYGSGNSLVGAFIYAGLQSLYANAAAGATYPDVRYTANTPIVTKMQEMTSGICANTNRFNNKWGDATRILDSDGDQLSGIDYSQFHDSTAAAASIAEGVGSFSLTDTRDGKPYLVRRLADGNCWMAQNLDLQLYSGLTLSAADTDIEEDWTLTPSQTSDEAKKGSTSSYWQDTHGVETVTLYEGTWDASANDGAGGWVESVVATCTGGTQQYRCFAKSETKFWTADALNNLTASNQQAYLNSTSTYASYDFKIYKLGLNTNNFYQIQQISNNSCLMYVNGDGNLLDQGSSSHYCRLETSGSPLISQIGDILNYEPQVSLPAVTSTSSGNPVPTNINSNRVGAVSDYAQSSAPIRHPSSAADYRWLNMGSDGAHAYSWGPANNYAGSNIDGTAESYIPEGETMQQILTPASSCSNATVVSGTLKLNGETLEFPVCADANDQPLASWHLAGSYYNWYAATAGTGLTTVTTTDESICPKGWQLPDGSSYSYNNLLDSLAGSKTNATTVVLAPVSTPLAGWYDPSEYYATSGKVRLYGTYIINTTSNRLGAHSWFLNYNAQGNNYITASRGLGTTIRCVAR